jgi:hypothetical protein
MSASQILLAGHGHEDQWLSGNPDRTYFEVNYKKPNNFMSYSYEVPFDQSAVYYGDSATCTLPTKGDFSKRFTVRSTLPTLYQPLGPGYVYPLYTDQVNGAVYIPDGTIAIQPGDFIGYFNTQFQGAWATNFVGYSNINVSYNSSLIKFVFTSTVYDYIYFPDDMSGVFWGFDPRSFDFVTSGGFKAYRFTNGVITAPFTLFQAGWIRGFTPPPGVGFSYVDSVACRLVKSATLLIGGQTIDTLTSERLIIEDDLGVAYENQSGLAILEGKGDASQVYAPREYYTRLTFNTDKLNMKAIQNQDVRIDIEYEKFENLPQTLITTKSLTDGASYVNTNIKTVLGLSENARVFHTNFYKQWIVYVINDPINANHQRYYFYDTTKPQGDASSWVYWYDPQFHQLGPVRPYFVGGTMYIASASSPYIRSVPVADMLTGTATATQGANIFPDLYDGNVVLNNCIADARYVYITVKAPMVTFGSNTASTYTYMPGNGGNGRTFTQTLNLIYNVLSISTPQLIASDNVAIVNFVTTSINNITFGQGLPVSVTITGETKVGSDINVTVNILYSSVVQIFRLPVFYTTTSVPLTGSNVATFTSCTPECAFANTYVTYKVYNIATPQLILTDNTAVLNFVTTVAQNFGGVTKTVTMGSQIKTLSNIFVTANVAYTYTSNGQPAPQVLELPFGYSTTYRTITVRYDTTKPIGQWSSYDFLSYPGTGAPRSWYDITGLFELAFSSMPLVFDGRNLYGTFGGSQLFLKTDTLNFLDLSSYTYFNVSTLSPVPSLIGSAVPNATDGRYFYFQGVFTGGSVYLTRYDSTQSISSPSAYSSILFTKSIFPNFYTLAPYGFDGKSIYYIGGTGGLPFGGGRIPEIFATILRYDTTTNTISDWIIFDGTGKAQTSKGTTVNTISWVCKNYINNLPNAAVLACLVSARYVYLTQTWGGGEDTFNDLVQFDPLVMDGGTLASSMIVKYETFDTPNPLRSQNLYGQTALNEFTIIQGQSTGSFKLDVRGPVREFWITVDSPGVINHVIFRLNDEILVDDDQIMTRYIRTFETHTSMPSSSNVCVYSVSWDPERLAPSGTVNMSRIADQTLDVTLVTQAPSNLTVRVYSKVFNVLAIQGGIGGLIFNS